jgi:N-acetylglutamate synthase-like GNAT family acetyltransferase
MTSIYIRNAKTADAKELSELILENAQQILKPHYNEQQWNVFTQYYSIEIVKEKIEKQSVFCAIQDKKIIGTIALDDDFVVGFYTRFENLKQGIGKILMKHLEDYAKTNGLQKLQLAASPEGLAFYYKKGWQKEKDISIKYFGIEFEETLMFKELI